MKVKIDDVLYDSDDQPIMVVLSSQEKGNIADMAPEAFMYCCYPEGMPMESVVEFMRLVKGEI